MDKKELQKVFLVIKLGLTAVLAVVVLYGSIYTVSEQERAVITQFGKYIDDTGAGLHFKIPFIQDVRKVETTIKGMELGYRTVNGEAVSFEKESFMITKDFNFVNVDFYIEWWVCDPVKYLYNSEDKEELLKNILQSEARSVVSSYNVDEVLTTGKTAIQNAVRDGVLSKLAEYDIGMEVTNVSLQDAQAPTEEVAAAFRNVENAKQNMETAVNVANTYANQVLPQARADADKLIREAEAVRESRINEATGQTARFDAMFSEYIRNKEITKTRIYLETMEEILPGVKLVIGGEDITKILDLSKSQTDDAVRNAAVNNAAQDAAVAGEGGGSVEN